jgi:hypothetical protein
VTATNNERQPLNLTVELPAELLEVLANQLAIVRQDSLDGGQPTLTLDDFNATCTYLGRTLSTEYAREGKLSSAPPRSSSSPS